MGSYDITQWLGDAADTLTDDQYARFAAAWAQVSHRYTGRDDAAEGDAALSAALQHILGETAPDDAGREVQHARHRLLLAVAAARQIAVMATEDGASENALHNRLGVTRRTLRQWLGKTH